MKIFTAVVLFAVGALASFREPKLQADYDALVGTNSTAAPAIIESGPGSHQV